MKTSGKTLSWNGTFLGTYGINCIKKEEKTVLKNNLATIRTSSFHTTCVIRRSQDPVLVCLLDELKVCFGIEKIGTHHIQIGNIIYVMFRYDPNFFPLKERFEADEDFKEKMRILICYRMLLRIPNTNNSSFLVVESKGKYRPISFVESKSCLDISPKAPSIRFLNKWFGTKDISSEILSIFPKRVWEEWSEFLLGFRSKIQDKICEIDPDYVWFTSFVIERMNGFC